MADLETLLAPVSEDNPVGEDLSYDHERQQIEQAFETGDGLDDSEGADRDWRSIVRMIEGQFSRTKDVWLPVYLCRAGAKQGSLETVELGAQALAGLFERYWDTVHPQLDELGLPGRKAPCDSLTGRGSFLMPLERVVLVAHPRLGAFTGADIERFRSEQTAAEGYGMFRATLDDMGEEPLTAAIARLNNIEEALRRADKIFTDAAAGEQSPHYAPTFAVLATLRQALSSFLVSGGQGAGEAADEAGEDGGDFASGGPARGGGGQRLSGKVNSRDDVVAALDMIADYYMRSEPSHPLRQLTERAKHWVMMDFMELMREIVPDATYQAQQLLNKREQ